MKLLLTANCRQQKQAAPATPASPCSANRDHEPCFSQAESIVLGSSPLSSLSCWEQQFSQSELPVSEPKRQKQIMHKEPVSLCMLSTCHSVFQICLSQHVSCNVSVSATSLTFKTTKLSVVERLSDHKRVFACRCISPARVAHCQAETAKTSSKDAG